MILLKVISSSFSMISKASSWILDISFGVNSLLSSGSSVTGALAAFFVSSSSEGFVEESICVWPSLAGSSFFFSEVVVKFVNQLAYELFEHRLVILLRYNSSSLCRTNNPITFLLQLYKLAFKPISLSTLPIFLCISQSLQQNRPTLFTQIIIKFLLHSRKILFKTSLDSQTWCLNFRQIKCFESFNFLELEFICSCIFSFFLLSYIDFFNASAFLFLDPRLKGLMKWLGLVFSSTSPWEGNGISDFFLVEMNWER